MPKYVLHGQEVLIAVKAYFDSSGSIDSSKIVALAGVAATDAQWRKFEVEWDEVLKSRSPVAPYLHMKEVAGSSGVFADEQGWDDKKRRQLVTDCFFYAQDHLNKDYFRSFVATLDMAYLRDLKKIKHIAMPSAVEVLNYYIPSKVFQWFLEELPQWVEREAYFYFDQNEPFMGEFQKLVRRRKKLSRLSNAWHMLRTVDPVDMAVTPQVQLADLVAWSHHRKLSTDDSRSWHSMSRFTDAGLPSTQAHINRLLLNKIATEWQLKPGSLEVFK